MDKERIEIFRYTPEKRLEWDSFVESSRNGTFLHKRAYMEYHSDRFCDHSLMFYCNSRLLALLPANKKDDKVISHSGLTYGALIVSSEIATARILELFNALTEYLSTQCNTKELIYRPVPHIYHRYPCEEDLYALFRNNAQLIERKASSTIKLSNPLPFKGRRKLTAAAKSRLRIVEEQSFAEFWKLLDNRLKEKYGVTPVHTLDEIELLHSLFPTNIRLYTISNENGAIMGGVVLYITDRVAHMQYSGTNEEGRRIGALDYLYEYIFETIEPGIEYFDFGISTEEGGHYLNEGLIAYKERLGGRATMYDTYSIEIKQR